MGQWNPKKIAWWHEQVADWMLQHPDRKQKHCAAEMSVTPTFIYMLTNSDAFREYWKQRRCDHVSFLSQDIVEKSEHLAHEALDSMIEKVQELGPAMSVDDLSKAADLALEAAGYKGKSAVPGTPIAGATYVFNAPAQVIQEARDSARNARLMELDNAEAPKLPAGGDLDEGVVPGQPALIHQEEVEAEGVASGGTEIREAVS